MSTQTDFLERLDSRRSTALAFATNPPATDGGDPGAPPLRQAVLDSLASGVVVLDGQGRVVLVNKAWKEFAGCESFSSSVPIGAHYPTVIAPDSSAAVAVAGWGAAVQSVFLGETEQFEIHSTEPHPLGTRHYLLRVTRLPGAEAGVVIEKVDITAQEAAKDALAGAWAEAREMKERLEAETVVVQGATNDFEEIVGRTPALTVILEQVRRVAETDAPVLVLGETGTGKDLLARAIHDRSSRRALPVITVNCAALPATLIESELFGYEKGAFTGAVARTPGRFEVASRSTLLLDEVGELPLEVQAKLLRVLQTGEFERLGSPKTLRTNARLIAATNRDLEREVREGRFRADLFFRLSVFPITLPPLRNRREDVPLLVWHAIARRQARLGRHIERVPDKLMRAFQAYSWPGNVRELENVVERALILSDGPTLAADPMFAGIRQASAPDAGTLSDVERQYILDVLERCGGRVGGPGKAAERLGLKRSTLMSRMKKLGINRAARMANKL